jgi:sterol desaturase/sphingolipid hydroxylase (fatty acid hydroxylase superfamily)
MQTHDLLVSIVLASGGVCMGLTTLAYAKMPERRIRAEVGRKLQGREFVVRVALNSLLSGALVLAFTHFLAGRLFYEHPIAWWRGALEATFILVLYDFLYYFLHRYPFHRWPWLKRVHSVHHRARHPIAIDSLFLHPVENVLGLALLTTCTFIVGPVNVWAFGACFFVYSWANIIVHCGVDLPIPYCGLLARKHDVHHKHMRAGNYASLSPLPDLVFGTAE